MFDLTPQIKKMILHAHCSPRSRKDYFALFECFCLGHKRLQSSSLSSPSERQVALMYYNFILFILHVILRQGYNVLRRAFLWPCKDIFSTICNVMKNLLWKILKIYCRIIQKLFSKDTNFLIFLTEFVWRIFLVLKKYA